MSLIGQLKEEGSGIIACHHFGFAVRSIVECAERISSVVEGEWLGDIIEDPLQQVRVSFISIKNCPKLELVEPINDASPINGYIKKGTPMYHICYEVNDIVKSIKYQKAIGSLVISDPKPAVAFNGREIAWVYTRDKMLIEFLSSKHR